MKQASVGVDIGGTNTSIGIVNKQGEVLSKTSIKTTKKDNAEEFFSIISKEIYRQISSLKQQHHKLEILGIGVGAPNGNYYTGKIEGAPNLAFKNAVPTVELLKEHFPTLKTIILTNDANAAAIGEMVYGGAKNMKNFVLYTLGTGVGSGLVINGEIVYGHDGFAGECGHATLIPNGRLCGCGHYGHLETYCSSSGIIRTTFELLTKYNNRKSPLANYSFKELSSRIVAEAALKGDEIALEVFEQTGKYMGLALADTIHTFSPEAIFFFGGPVAAGNLLLNPIKKYMEKAVMDIFRNKVKILPSQLKMGDAAIVGASALVW